MTLFFTSRLPFHSALFLTILLAPAHAASDGLVSTPIPWQQTGDVVQAVRAMWPNELLSAAKTDLDGDGIAEVLVRFDGSCVSSGIAGDEPGEDKGCPYSLLRWNGTAWQVILERSAWTVEAYSRNDPVRGATIAALEIDGELFTLRDGQIEELKGQVDPYIRSSTDSEVEVAQPMAGPSGPTAPLWPRRALSTSMTTARLSVSSSCATGPT